MCKGFWSAAIIGAGLLASAGTIHAIAQPSEPTSVQTSVGPGAGSGSGNHEGHGGHGLIAGLIAHFHQMHGEHIAALHQQMNLTDAQRDAVHETLRSHHADIAAAIRPVVEAKRDLHAAVFADSTNEAAIRAASVNLGNAVGEAAIVFARIKTEVISNAHLTPEQMTKLAEIRADVNDSIDSFLNELEQGR